MKQIIPGLTVTVLIAVFSTFLAQTDFIKETVKFSPLIIAILTGVIVGNLFKFSEKFKPGIVFSLKKILRTAIVFLGFRLTFQNVAEVGLEGLIVDSIMLIGTFLLGVFVSTKIFKLDSSMGYLLASGSSICGASAVLATAPVVKAPMHHAAMAVATVTIFGTLSMFLYPVVYKAGLLLDFDDLLYGLFTGATVHEVAQVVAAGFAISDPAGNTATIAKLTRVMMLAPLLIVLSFYLAKKHATHGAGVTLRDIPIPYFVFGFIAMVGVNSTGFIPADITQKINVIDGFLLTVAMAAMGIETNINKMKGVGMKPIYVAFIMFLFLFFGGIAVVKVVHEIIG
ncbi:MAG TPA: YeiH family putative sulfate export transporter [Persephonella sp.]|uniref:Membrane protein n=1 Tax=Persephonella marina (strain DSM 14350 / EX-H1) TaxID=123214 RepID=C0QP61_PERMH|nr:MULTISPECIES: YeiH family protein [Persephonella]ACO03686.1 membrane protein [Persephonella marina EX-H1]HCB69928.1 YeiH family putative sulfate export transporter [Persephonella sp.]